MSRVSSILGGLRRAPTVWRTIRPLRPAQAWAQLEHALRGLPEPTRRGGASPRLAVPSAEVPFLPPAKHVRGDPTRIELLAVEIELPDQVDWESTLNGPLVAYHLHEQEYLRLDSFRPVDRAQRILDWTRRHTAGTGWDPHPISLRLLTWGKLLLTPGALPEDEAFREAMLRSLGDQAATLAAGLEVRLQANHLLSNLLGVVWAGILIECAESDRWRSLSPRFVDELDRQVHPDGGHEERSPMYHALLLENLLDLLNLCRSAPNRAPAGLAEALEATTSRMLGALAVLTHGDGRIALFADSAHDVAASLAALRMYGGALGVPHESDEVEGASHPTSALLPQTGYVRLVTGRFDLIASVAGVSPPHQPGHAHCDALSFELSVAGRRLITDTGLYEYRPGERRHRARSTASHSSLEIDGQEQAEIWSAHRVGGRPEVRLTMWQVNREATAEPVGEAEATCRGWSSRAPLHRRRFEVTGEGVQIEDRIEGACRDVVSRLFFAPGWELELGPDCAVARFAVAGDPAATPSVRIELPTVYSWAIETLPFYPTFGREEQRAALVGRASGPVESTITFQLPDIVE